jgi:hypothetical protein
LPLHKTERPELNDDAQLCQRAIRKLVEHEPEFVVSMLDEWMAEAHTDGDVEGADALLDLRPHLVSERPNSEG